MVYNICSYYIPLICHEHKFTNQIKEFLQQKIDLQIQECDHSSKLKLDVIDILADNLIRNYFQFLLKIMNGCIDPPEKCDRLKYRKKPEIQKK